MEDVKQKLKSTARTAALRSLCGQAAVCAVPLVLLLGSAIRAVRHRGGAEPAAALCAFLALCALAGVCGLVWLALCLRAAEPKRLGGALRRAVPLCLVLALALALRLPQWGTAPRDDSVQFYAELYAVCRDFVFEPRYWAESFALFNHPSWGFAALISIAEFLRPGDYNNILAGNTALSLVTVFCVWDMLADRRRLGPWGAFWAALIVACDPMLLGLCSFLQTDFGCAACIFWVLWAYDKRRSLLLAGAVLLTVTSKEMGIALVVGLFLGLLTWRVCAARPRGAAALLRAALGDARDRLLCLLCLVGGVGILSFILLKGNLSENATTMMGTKMLYLDLPYVGYKLVQCLTVNFTWLMLLLVPAWGVYARRHGAARPCAMLSAGAVGAAVLYQALSCCVVTAVLPRYNLSFELLLCFAAAVAAVQLTQSLRGAPGRALPRLGLAALLGVQAYLSIDPVMPLFYAPIDTGAVPIYQTARFRWEQEELYIGGCMIYNFQYTYLDDCIRDMLAAEGYDEDTDIIVLGNDSWFYLGGRSKYGWEPSTQDYSFVFGPETLFFQTNQTIEARRSVQSYHEKGLLKSRAIFVWAPRTPALDLPEDRRAEEIPSYYTNVQQHEIDRSPFGTLTYFTADYTG